MWVQLILILKRSFEVWFSFRFLEYWKEGESYFHENKLIEIHAIAFLSPLCGYVLLISGVETGNSQTWNISAGGRKCYFVDVTNQKISLLDLYLAWPIQSLHTAYQSQREMLHICV